MSVPSGRTTQVYDDVWLFERLETLFREYRSVVCPVAAALFAAGNVLPGSLLREADPLVKALFVPILFPWAAAAVACLHFHDLSRQRVQQLAASQGVRARVGKDFCFEEAELQMMYDEWQGRRPFWKVIDWTLLLFHCSYLVKLYNWEDCKPTVVYQLWMVPVGLSVVCRAAGGEALSVRVRSAISLAACVFIRTWHISHMLAGDQCVLHMCILGHNFSSASMSVKTVASCVIYIFDYLMFPVTQSYVPWKLAINFLGGLPTIYMHALVRGTAMDFSLDTGRWDFLCIFMGMSATAMAIFLFAMVMNEEMMCHFLKMHNRASRD